MNFLSTRSARARWPYTLMLLLLAIVSVLPVAAQPGGDLREAFSSTAAPNGWTVINHTDNVGWRFDDPGRRGNQTGGSGGFAITDSDFAGEGTQMDTELRTPALNFSGASTVQLKFKTHFRAYEESKADIEVSSNNGQSWDLAWRQTGANASGQITLNISQFAAGKPAVIIRFRYYDANWAWYWQIDDVEVIAPSAPAAPGSLSATAAANQVNQIDLTWSDNSANETSFKVERSPDGANWSQLASLNADVTSYADAGLTCGTTYHYRVRAANAAGNSGYSNTVNAAVAACTNLTTLNEAFTSASTPTGWKVISFAGPDEVWRFDDPAARGNQTGGSGAFAIADSDFAGEIAMGTSLETPVMNFSGVSAVELSFKTYFRLYNNPDITADNEEKAEVWVSGNNGQSWTKVWTVPPDVQTTKVLDISEWAANQSAVLVSFDYTGAFFDYYWQIDDVNITAMATPGAPSNLQATVGPNNQVNLAWNGSTPNYEVERRDPGSSTFVKIADITNGAAVYADSSAKSSGAAYAYRVRARSAAGPSGYSNTAQVTTSAGSSTVVVDLAVSYYTAINATTRTAIEANLGYFADSVYEMSNGAHKIGKITIHSNGDFIDRADIIWVQSCHPNAYISGYARLKGPFKRIEHCDVFGGSNFMQDEQGRREGGYTIGHEFGHYFYSLYDEYQGGTQASNDVSDPLASDTPVEFSVMNSQWVAAQQNDYRWLNFSTRANNFGRIIGPGRTSNAQFRTYGASAWETLVRPLVDDQRTNASTKPLRIYHPVLLTAQPPDLNQLPSLELPGAQATARSNLSFVYATNPVVTGLNLQAAAPSGVARQLVIDASARMGVGDLLENVKAAAQQLVDRADLGDTIGIIAFSDTISVTQPLTVIADEATRTAIKAAIDSIVPGTADLATGAALQQALTDLSSLPPETTRAVYLIAGSRHTTGVAPFNLVGDYQAASVKLYTLGYVTEPEVTVELQELAEQTGGAFTFIDGDGGDTTGTVDVLNALRSTDQAVIPLVHVAIKSGYAVADSVAPLTIPFYVDSSLGELEVQLTHTRDITDVTVTLLDPAGNTNVVPCAEQASTAYREIVCYLKIAGVVPGTWSLQALAEPDLERSVHYWVGGSAKAGVPTFAAKMDTVIGQVAEYPEPIVLRAAVGKNLPIAGALVTGRIEAPDGTISSVTLRDDGVAPDHLAADGVYAAIVKYGQDGTYNITVSFDNSAGNAQFTDKGGAAHAGVTVTPVGENFERFTEFQVTISGWEADDHNDLLEKATGLQPDNSIVAGQIDYAGDRDTFAFTVPANYNGTLIVRISGLGLGMDPYVYTFDAERTFELESFFDYVATSDDYLSVPLGVTGGQVIYVDVSHYDENATSGLYEISVGPELPREQSTSNSKNEPTSGAELVYLPLLHR
jgi:hypothetical protein